MHVSLAFMLWKHAVLIYINMNGAEVTHSEMHSINRKAKYIKIMIKLLTDCIICTANPILA